jgi:hypothetical protein
MVGQQVIEEALMNSVAREQLETAPLGGESGPLGRETRSLRQRAGEVRAFTDRLPLLSELQVVEALQHIRVVIHHIAAHGAAEERLLYPYLQECAEVAALRADHVRMNVLARAIHEWTPAHGPAALHSLLDDFSETSDFHLLVEGEVCMPVVHEHVVSGAEQFLFEAVEIDAFDGAVTQAPAP